MGSTYMGVYYKKSYSNIHWCIKSNSLEVYIHIECSMLISFILFVTSNRQITNLVFPNLFNKLFSVLAVENCSIWETLIEKIGENKIVCLVVWCYKYLIENFLICILGCLKLCHIRLGKIRLRGIHKQRLLKGGGRGQKFSGLLSKKKTKEEEGGRKIRKMGWCRLWMVPCPLFNS